MAERKVAIRLGTTGKAEVKNDFAEIGKSGTDAMAGVGQAAEQAATRSEAASERQLAAWRRAGEALRNAQMQDANQRAFNSQLGVGRGDSNLNAAIVQQMRERVELEDRMAVAAARLRAELDPLWAAQQRYNTELAEARTLQAAGAITTEQLATKQGMLSRELQQTTLALGRGAGSAGQMRAASQQLSYQISDVAVSFAGGINPMMIFAQQGSQVVQALALMKGEAKGLLGFLAGPWGAALMGAATLLGLLLTSSDKASEGHKRHKEAALGTAEAIDELNKRLEKNIQTSEQAARAALQNAAAQLTAAQQIRQTIKADIDREIARLKIADTQPDGDGGINFGVAVGGTIEKRLQVLRQSAAEQEKLIRDAAEGVRMAAVPVLQSIAKEGLDPVARATGQYERSVAALNERLRAGAIDSRQYRQEYGELTKAHNSEVEALRKSTKETKGKSDADRAAAMATREAAKAQRELESDLTSLIASFDPARKAALDYAATLQQIADVQKAGLLSGGEAMVFSLRASMENRKQEAEDLRRSTEEFYKGIGVDPQSDMKEIAKLIDGRRQMESEEIRSSAQQRDDAIRSTAALYTDLMRGGSRSIWQEFKLLGMQVLAEVLARLTVGGNGGQSMGSMITSAVSKLITRNASGTEYAPGGLSFVAENGPELIQLPRGSKVTPAPQTRRLLAANDGGLAPVSMSISIDATGADAEGLARVQRSIDQLRAELPARIVGTFRDARARNAL